METTGNELKTYKTEKKDCLNLLQEVSNFNEIFEILCWIEELHRNYIVPRQSIINSFGTPGNNALRDALPGGYLSCSELKEKGKSRIFISQKNERFTIDFTVYSIDVSKKDVNNESKGFEKSFSHDMFDTSNVEYGQTIKFWKNILELGLDNMAIHLTTLKVSQKALEKAAKEIEMV